MNRGSNGRFGAPIAYEAVRRNYNLVRLAGAGLIGLASFFAFMWELPTAPYVLGMSTIVAADALLRLAAPGSPVGPLFIDVTAIGAVLLIRGSVPSGEVAAFAYILSASMLLLPLIRAALMVLYAATWAVVAVSFTPLIAEPTRTELQNILFDRIAMGVFLGITAVLLFLAGQALYRAARQHREAMESQRRSVEIKNEFVSMVSHELRTPLTSIAGFTDTLREAWQSLEPNEVEEFLTIMRRETEHLANLVEDILVIPRLEAGRLQLEPTELDLRAEAFATGRLVFQPENGTELEVAIPGGIRVYADPVRLRQILRNLLENARKYGGDQVLVEGTQAGDLYRVAVSDNGPGVPEKDRERIFEHFEQVTKGDARSDQGVGLGLPIARKLARAMGGDLWYEARFPVGARFCFTLQLADAAPQQAVVPATPSSITAV